MTNRENALLVYNHKMPKSVPNFFTDFDVWDSYGERYFGEGTGDDWFGINWTDCPDQNSQMETPGQKKMDGLENWQEKIKMPNLDSYDWEAIAAEATKNWDRENRVSLCMLLNGPFERMTTFLGFENALFAFYDYPDEVHELFKTITDHKLKYLEILKKYFDFDIIAFHDDWGDNKNMFFPMDMWIEFIKPYIKQVIDKTKELGMKFEMHTCGYIAPTIEHLIEMGADAIDPLQFCNNVPEIKAKYGDKIVLSGGFNTQGVLEMSGVSEEDIRAEVRRCIDDLAPGGNYATLVPIIDKKVVEIVASEIGKHGENYYIKNNNK